MQDNAAHHSEQMISAGKAFLAKAGRFAGRILFGLLKPYIPFIIAFAVVFVLVLAVSTVFFAQLTAEPGTVKAEDGETLEVYIKEAVEKANNRSQYDSYGRDIMLELTEGQVWALVAFKNTASTLDLTKEEIDKMANKLKPSFKYTVHERIIENLITETDPETGKPVLNEDGTVRKKWVVTSHTPETLLISADTLLGKYEYTYKKVTETTGDVRITYMQPYETKLVGEPYERLKKFLKEELRIAEGDMDIAVQAVLECANGYQFQEERMAWLLGGSTSWNVNYTGIPPEIIPAIQEASQRFNIPEWLIAGIIQIESGFNPLARNINSGAYGLMQIMPSHINGGLFELLGFSRTADRDNPRAQVIAGTYLLHRHILRYINPAAVDWNSDMWKQQTLLGIINYGGYTNDKVEEGKAKYASKVWAAADMYRLSGNTGMYMMWPLPGKTYISSHFGARIDPVYGTQAFHNGIDIPAEVGTLVLSATSGTVVFSGWAGGYGNLVVIESGRYQFLYAHNSRLLVRTGQQVSQGQIIAEVGSTGKSTGSHLHFGISIGDYRNGKFINPLTLVNPR